MQEIVIKKEKKGWVMNMHPWISSSAFESYSHLKDKSLVQVLDEKHKFLAYGFFNKKSVVPIKILSYNKKDNIDEKFFEKLIMNADKKREKKTIYRAFNAEADGIPGLTIDVFSNLVLYEISVGALLPLEKMIINIIKNYFSPQYIAKTGRVSTSVLEKLDNFALEWVGKGMKSLIHIIEYDGLKYCFDLKEEINILQRENWKDLSNYTKNKEVLTLFCNNNGNITAIKSGDPAHITAIDLKPIDNIKMSYNENGFKISKDTFLSGDIYKLLDSVAKKDKSFDLIVIDYPNYIKSYKDKLKSIKSIMFLLQKTIGILKNNGTIVFSMNCGFISGDDFYDIIKTASIKEKTKMQIFKKVSQGSDFPTLSVMPESNVFNCVWMRKI